MNWIIKYYCISIESFLLTSYWLHTNYQFTTGACDVFVWWGLLAHSIIESCADWRVNGPQLNNLELPVVSRNLVTDLLVVGGEISCIAYILSAVCTFLILSSIHKGPEADKARHLCSVFPLTICCCWDIAATQKVEQRILLALLDLQHTSFVISRHSTTGSD